MLSFIIKIYKCLEQFFHSLESMAIFRNNTASGSIPGGNCKQIRVQTPCGLRPIEPAR